MIADPEAVNAAAAVLVTLLGTTWLLRPALAGRLFGLRARRPRGVSELRATFGGFFAGSALCCLALDAPEAYAALGAGWVAAALARAGSIVADRALCAMNLLGLAAELAIGACLLV